MPVQINPFLSYDTGYPDKHLVMTGDGFQKMLNFLEHSPVLTFDFETSGVQWYKDSVSCGLALSGWDRRDSSVHSFYVPYRHQTGEHQLDLGIVGPAFKQLLADESKIKLAHNLKFDEHFARKEGWQVKGNRYDTMIAARLSDENRPLALKIRAEQDLGRNDATEWEERVGTEVLKLARIHQLGKTEYMAKYGYSQVAIPICGTYACLDAEFTLGLYFLYERAGLSQKYPRIWATEMALIEVLCDMEEVGLPVDVDYLVTLRDSLRGIQRGLELDVKRLLGREIDLGKDEELRNLLINGLGFNLTKLTKSKKTLSVDGEVLSSLKDRHPVIPVIMKWRDAEKIRNTYTDSILDRLDANNILHADFQQTGTNTGRLSCRQPNFQNQPTDDDGRSVEFTGLSLEAGGIDPWSIRRAFVNRGKGWVRLFYDYEQIELKILAFYSQDPIMVDNYLKGGDIHDRTSMEIFGSTEKKYRRKAKVANFGLAFGLTALGLSRQLNIPLPEAEAFMVEFDHHYAGVGMFKAKFCAQVCSQGCEFQNLFGRPRRLPGLVNPSYSQRGRSERQAIATLIQGTAAELTKESMVRVWRRFKAEGLPAWLVNTVHDEIQVDCHVDSLASVCRVMREEMERFPEFEPIPIVVGGEYSTESWADKKGLSR